MSVLVKICGFRDADQVAAAVAAGADAIGFVFAESVRRVSVQAAVEAARCIPPTVRRVAVMRHPANGEWAEVRDVFAPDVLQTDAQDFADLDVPDNIVCWPVLRQGSPAALKDPAGEYVYEGRNSGKGEVVDWSQAASVARGSQMILAGGLSPTNVTAAIQSVRPYGVDVSSGVESQPGVKDSDLIRKFIHAVRAVESRL
jgi:phosphoribosylanthranilate isomerase